MSNERQSTLAEQAADAVADIRKASGVADGQGPDDAHIAGAVRGFVEAFDYWYIRVVRNAVPKYRTLIIGRVNPFIRRIECDGMSAPATARRLVADWNNRNFVTAGGWAIEEMAVTVSADSQKSSAEGIDIQRFDPNTGDYHLYVLKSGLVTRNADIVKALKRNSRQAERLLLQGRSTGRVHAYYAIAAGKNTSTFEDGIHRPSSAEFWQEMTGLEPSQAVDLAFAIAAVAGTFVRVDASRHVQALELVTETYIASPTDPQAVDWDFIIDRTMREKAVWNMEDRNRHKRAMDALAASGYAE